MMIVGHLERLEKPPIRPAKWKMRYLELDSQYLNGTIIPQTASYLNISFRICVVYASQKEARRASPNPLQTFRLADLLDISLRTKFYEKVLAVLLPAFPFFLFTLVFLTGG